MSGPLKKAKRAYAVYGDDFGSMELKGGKGKLKNSSGDLVWVDDDDPVYHRGRGNFGLYDAERDAARHSKRAKDPIGTGKYRHTDDKKRSRR